MKNFILLTFYNRQTEEKPSWEVYGHISPGNNKLLISLPLRERAIAYAHGFYKVPVMEGMGYERILDLLSRENI